jgi:hypothetical protein
MKKNIVMIFPLLFLCLVNEVKASINLIEIPIKETNAVIVAKNFVSEYKILIAQNNMSIEVAEDLLISYINEKPSGIPESMYLPKLVLSNISKISASKRVEDYIDSVIKSDKQDLYSAAIESYFRIFSYTEESLRKIEEYILINDNTSIQRRAAFYVFWSKTMDFEENIFNNDLKIIKLMLKYLKKDLHNWVYLDNALSNKIPSYRHSLQRRDLIEYLEMNLTSLSNVNQNKYNQIKLEINSSPNESYIDLTDEIIENDLENYVKLPSCSIDMWIK